MESQDGLLSAGLGHGFAQSSLPDALTFSPLTASVLGLNSVDNFQSVCDLAWGEGGTGGAGCNPAKRFYF